MQIFRVKCCAILFCIVLAVSTNPHYCMRRSMLASSSSWNKEGIILSCFLPFYADSICPCYVRLTGLRHFMLGSILNRYLANVKDCLDNPVPILNRYFANVDDCLDNPVPILNRYFANVEDRLDNPVPIVSQ